MTVCAPSTAARAASGSRRSWSPERTIVTSAPSACRSRTTALPRKPAPPVTVTARPSQCAGAGSATLARPHAAAGELILDDLHVGVDHDPHELLEGHLRLPAELLARLGRIAAQRVDLGRAVVLRVDLDVALPVHADVRRRLVEEVAHRVRLAGGDDVVVGLV